MAIGATLIGLLIAAQGVLGLAAPSLFVGFVSSLQVSPIIYFAALVRVAIGVVLVRAAPHARAAHILRGLGVVIVAGGLATPFVGARFAGIVLELWTTEGPTMVRVWAAAALAIGLFVVYAASPRRADA